MFLIRLQQAPGDIMGDFHLFDMYSKGVLICHGLNNTDFRYGWVYNEQVFSK